MPTVNEAYADAAIRHQVYLRRYSAAVNSRILKLLERADAELAEMLRKRLARIGQPVDFTSKRWQELLTDVRAMRQEALKAYREQVDGDLGDLVGVEHAAEVSAIQGATVAGAAIEVQLATVAPQKIRAIAYSQPMNGRLLREWYQDLDAADRRRLVQAIQNGMATGETVDQIVRRIVGTRANSYTDGILSISRREATAIARTAINHISTAAREQVWIENQDMIAAKIWVSTLDGRTSAVCRARDGKASSIGGKPLPDGLEPLIPNNAKPPAHINCRSTMIAYINGETLAGDRPFVADTRTRREREADFRREASATGKSLRQIRAEWANKYVGGVPAVTNYEAFLKRQPASFQDDVLGKTKGALFRRGGLKLDQFVDRSGREYTIEQLRAKVPDAFEKAGIAA